MERNTAFATIAILSSALFAGTLAIGLTLQPAAAVCSPKNPKVCASTTSAAGSPGAETGSASGAGVGTAPAPNARTGNPSAPNSFATSSDMACSGHPSAVKNGQTTCAP